MRQSGFGSQHEPFIERATFVGFDMAEGDPTEAREIDDACSRRGNRGEQRPLAGVEEQRFIGIDEKLVEGETLRPRYSRNQRGESINLIRDLVDFGFHSDRSPFDQLNPRYAIDRNAFGILAYRCIAQTPLYRYIVDGTGLCSHVQGCDLPQSDPWAIGWATPAAFGMAVAGGNVLPITKTFPLL